jgi:lipoprotein-anchoring transpeptidase ErfK/SrfK
LFSEGIFLIEKRPDARHPFWAIRLLVGVLLVGLSLALLRPQVAFAQAPEQTAEEEAAGLTVLVSRYKTVPPLPFPGPQVGPIIDHSFDDDVDRRTTAFIPRDLSALTPIDLPKDVDRWIRVDLSEQTLVAYEGDQPIRAFIVSTGLPGTPTVTGTFHIRMKVRSQTMVGGDPALGNYYNLPNVEWVQYFYEDYGFHGTYWHNNFGHPMSHGCVNMTNADAKWLWDWASPTWDGKTVWDTATEDDPGTLVIVHD